jgi:hypothetical protein
MRSPSYSNHGMLPNHSSQVKPADSWKLASSSNASQAAPAATRSQNHWSRRQSAPPTARMNIATMKEAPDTIERAKPVNASNLLNTSSWTRTFAKPRSTIS